MCKVYEIKGNEHYSKGFNFGLVYEPKSMTRTVRFYPNCSYNLYSMDQADINKLFGFSFGYHHHNSVRFGWRYLTPTGTIELLAYVYRDGELIMEWDEDESIKLCEIKMDRDYNLSIQVTDDNYHFFVRNGGEDIIAETTIKRPKKSLPIGYELFPYFGGNRKAPNTMNIKVCK